MQVLPHRLHIYNSVNGITPLRRSPTPPLYLSTSALRPKPTPSPGCRGVSGPRSVRGPGRRKLLRPGPLRTLAPWSSLGRIRFLPVCFAAQPTPSPGCWEGPGPQCVHVAFLCEPIAARFVHLIRASRPPGPRCVRGPGRRKLLRPGPLRTLAPWSSLGRIRFLPVCFAAQPTPSPGCWEGPGPHCDRGRASNEKGTQCSVGAELRKRQLTGLKAGIWVFGVMRVPLAPRVRPLILCAVFTVRKKSE